MACSMGEPSVSPWHAAVRPPRSRVLHPTHYFAAGHFGRKRRDMKKKPAKWPDSVRWESMPSNWTMTQLKELDTWLSDPSNK
jgi:hypothetical protein